MKIAVIGRTQWLLNAAYLLFDAGYEIGMVATGESHNHYGCGLDDYEALASKCKAPLLVGTKALENALSQNECEMAISVNWPTVLNEKVIQAFPRGILNAHAGDLPRYRGNACPNWAILNGEEKIGLCVHFMEPNSVDSGPVLLRDYFPLTEDTYITDIYAWLGQAIPKLLVGAVHGISSGSIEPEPLEPAMPMRCYPRRPEDGRIDWSNTAHEVYKLIRASSRPFDGAFTFLEGVSKVVIWRANLVNLDVDICAVPGQLMFKVGQYPVVACGAGALKLLEISIDGLSSENSLDIVCRSFRNRLT